MSLTAATNSAAEMTLTLRTVNSRRIWRDSGASWQISRSTRRAALEPAHQHSVDLALGPRAAPTSCPRRERRRRILAIHSGGTQTASTSPVHNSARQRAGGGQPVGLRPRLRDTRIPRRSSSPRSCRNSSRRPRRRIDWATSGLRTDWTGAVGDRSHNRPVQDVGTDVCLAPLAAG
jgi:hypothetical protein